MHVVLPANTLSYCNIAKNKGISTEQYLGGGDNPLNLWLWF